MPKKKSLKKELKGDLTEFGLIKRWNIISKEKAKQYAPLRIALEKHEVEHRLMKML